MTTEEIKKVAKEKFGNGKYLTEQEEGFREGAEWAWLQIKDRSTSRIAYEKCLKDFTKSAFGAYSQTGDSPISEKELDQDFNEFWEDEDTQDFVKTLTVPKSIMTILECREQLVSFLRQYQKACEIMHVNKIDAKNFVDQYETN